MFMRKLPECIFVCNVMYIYKFKHHSLHTMLKKYLGIKIRVFLCRNPLDQKKGRIGRKSNLLNKKCMLGINVHINVKMTKLCW